jgi:hypothetical protein
MINLKPKSINDCLVDPRTMDLLLNTDFLKNNVLLRGRAGVGKTTITKLLNSNHPSILIYENVDENFSNNYKPIIGTTNKLDFNSKIFDIIIDVNPLDKLTLLKSLSKLISNNITSNSLYHSIFLYYPNINKILTHYFNEN